MFTFNDCQSALVDYLEKLALSKWWNIIVKNFEHFNRQPMRCSSRCCESCTKIWVSLFNYKEYIKNSVEFPIRQWCSNLIFSFSRPSSNASGLVILLFLFTVYVFCSHYCKHKSEFISISLTVATFDVATCRFCVSRVRDPEFSAALGSRGCPRTFPICEASRPRHLSLWKTTSVTTWTARYALVTVFHTGRRVFR